MIQMDERQQQIRQSFGSRGQEVVLGLGKSRLRRLSLTLTGETATRIHQRHLPQTCVQNVQAESLEIAPAS